MLPESFQSWLLHMAETRSWSGREAARQLGCGVNQVKQWRENGAPLYIGLACNALAQGLPPWSVGIVIEP
jgi:hypothetical protein